MRIILLLIALLLVAWLSLTQFNAVNKATNSDKQTENNLLVPKNAEDLKQLKTNVDALMQQSAENTQKQIDAATRQ